MAGLGGECPVGFAVDGDEHGGDFGGVGGGVGLAR